MTLAGDPHDQPAAVLGARIRSFRKSRGLTLVELAKRAELSHPFLSQLERGQTRPSIASLDRIARALGSSQVELMASGDTLVPGELAPRVTIVRQGEGTEGPLGSGSARILVRGDVSFIPMDFRGRNSTLGSFYQHDEDEFVHVLSGIVVMDLGDDGLFTLAEGDSIHYVGGTPHRMCSKTEEDYRVLLIKQRLSR